ncbi:class I SAM-dependent methyltransferase [candidate division KSB1 bacterium]
MEYSNMDEIYRKLPLEKIPWNIESPPDELVKLIESGIIQPCKTIDFGCGTGSYTVYLAGRGFDVTGVDISPTAIEIARNNAVNKGATCQFIVSDVLGDLAEVRETFDFAYDWELLHHIFPEHREKYIQNVYRKLNPDSSYYSLCFSEKNRQFGGSGKYRETPIGTVLYFSSENELKELFEPYFMIEELKTIQIKGKYGPHEAVYAFMRRK